MFRAVADLRQYARARLMRYRGLPPVIAIVVLPMAAPVTTPLLFEALLTVATEGVDEVHVTIEFKFSWLLSANMPVAVNESSMVLGTLVLRGAT